MRALLAELEARLADPEVMARAAPGASDDAEGAAAARGGRPVAAAVLVPILLHEGAPSILLTLRSVRLASHAGQVAVPGGRSEAGETA